MSGDIEMSICGKKDNILGFRRVAGTCCWGRFAAPLSDKFRAAETASVRASEIVRDTRHDISGRTVHAMIAGIAEVSTDAKGGHKNDTNETQYHI